MVNGAKQKGDFPRSDDKYFIKNLSMSWLQTNMLILIVLHQVTTRSTITTKTTNHII